MALPEPDYISVRDVATYLNVTIDEVKWYITEGHLKAYIKLPEYYKLFQVCDCPTNKLCELAELVTFRFFCEEMHNESIRVVDKDGVEIISDEEINCEDILLLGCAAGIPGNSIAGMKAAGRY